MWKQDILESLDELKKMYLLIHPNRISYLNSIYEKVKDSIPFYFGEFSGLKNVFNGSSEEEVQVPIRFPYNNVLFEFEDTGDDSEELEANNEPETKKKTHIREAFLIEQDGDNFSITLFGCGDLKSWMVLDCQCFIEQLIESRKINLHAVNIYHEKINKDMVQPSIMNSGWIAITLNNVLSCGNILYKDVIPPEKLNKKRQRSGNLPLYSYKIIEISEHAVKEKNAGSVPWDYKSPTEMRFHLTRGHQKTYTKEKPLFGKYVGKWWWKQQARGDKNIGIIEKEYHVKKDKE